MRDPNRIDGVLEELSKYWKRVPDLRFCQLISNITNGKDIYYLKDEDLIIKLHEFFNEEEK